MYANKKVSNIAKPASSRIPSAIAARQHTTASSRSTINISSIKSCSSNCSLDENLDTTASSTMNNTNIINDSDSLSTISCASTEIRFKQPFTTKGITYAKQQQTSTAANSPAKFTNTNNTKSRKVFSYTHNEQPLTRESSSSSLSNYTSDDLVKKIEELVNRNRTFEEENNVLRNLINEESKQQRKTTTPHSFDERRILMLKCQIYQLEKQINILSESISFRKNAQAEAYSTLALLSEKFRNILQNESNSFQTSTTTQYSIDKSELTKWIETIESTKIKLIKVQDNEEEETEKLSQPSLFNLKYAKPTPNNATSLLDVCSGNLNHVNLKEIASLESNLAELYKHLIRFRESLKTLKNLNNNETPEAKMTSNGNGHKNVQVLPFHRENVKKQLDDCIDKTVKCTDSLFDLALLVPAAPWSAIKKSPIENVTQEMLMSRLKSIGLPKLKHQPVEMLLKSYHVACSYQNHMRTLEVAALNEELKFYRSCYSLQKSYIESIINLFRVKYEQFNAELNEHFYVPIGALNEKFWLMKEDTSEDKLRDFLTLYKLECVKFDKLIQSNARHSAASQDQPVNTFDQLINKLDDEINKLNKLFLTNMEKFNSEVIDLKSLCLESDQLLDELLKPSSDTPSSPQHPSFNVSSPSKHF